MPVVEPVTGIVVCGGQSSRMGRDKSLLDYHGLPQWQYLFEMLSALCAGVYLSVNELQAASLPATLPLLTDLPECREAGPAAALLTAASLLPGRALLLVGCDYPFLTEETLGHFLSTIDRRRPAAFYNEQAGVYEPLLAYYPAQAIAEAQAGFGRGNASLQAVLRQLQAYRYLPPDPRSIHSADTPEQYQAALAATSPPGFKKEG